MGRSGPDTLQLPPVIAIHGVGNHEPTVIERRIEASFSGGNLSAKVSEFNWDEFADHSVRRVRDAVALLDATAESISQAAALPLPPGRGQFDRLLQRAGEFLYQGVFRALIALGLSALVMAPLLLLLLRIPMAAFEAISLSDFAWLGAVARAVLWATIAVLLLLLGLALLRSVVSTTLAPLWGVVRRVALLLIQPVILLVTVPLSPRFGGLLRGLGDLLPMALLGAVLNLVLAPLSGDFAEMGRAVGGSALFLTAAAVVGGLHILLRRLWIGGPLKVLLDIARYMGSPEYRERVQSRLDQRIRDLSVNDGGPRRVMFYAHSLGSVIALDSLINSTVWNATDEVELVTLGSPIRRWFLRFFPRYLFPASIQGAARLAASRVKRLTWINMHRKWDYVGTSLGLERAGAGVDICTGQAWRVLRSHTDYWGDPVVVNKLREGLEFVQPVSGSAVEPSDRASLPLAASTTGPQIFLARWVSRAAAALVAVLLGVAVVKFLQERREWLDRIDSSRQSVEQFGIPSHASVTYHRTLEGAGENQYYLHHFGIRLPAPIGDLEPIEIPYAMLSEHARRFDYKALAKHVLEDCTRAEKKRWWQIFRSKKSIPCTRTAIAVRYDAQNPERLSFPGFPPRSTFWGGVGEVAGGLLLLLFYALVWVLLVFKGGVPLFRLFLGLPARAVSG